MADGCGGRRAEFFNDADAVFATIGELQSALDSWVVHYKHRASIFRPSVESAKHAGIGAGLFSAAGLVALFGLGSLIAAAIAALSLALPLWAAALIVAVVLFAVAGVAGLVSKKQLGQASPTPEMTAASRWPPL